MLAFGAVYSWAAPPLLAIALAAMWLARALPSHRDLIDAAALSVIAMIGLQLMPLPPAAHALLAAEGSAYRAAMALDYDPQAWAPLSLDPRKTRTMLMLAAAAFALLAATRRIAVSEGRRIGRWIAWLALLVSLMGLGGRMLFGERVYGFWTPLDPSAQPYGPIINRNHFAAWAVMAAALAIGSLAAHVARRREHAQTGRAAIAMLSDTRALWLLFAAAVTVATIVATASRSGVAALVVAGVTATLLITRHAGRRASVFAAGIALVCVIAAFSWSRPDRLITRLDVSSGELGLRQTIWQQSIGIAERYPLTGAGAGAFPAAMAYYQHGTRAVFFNHAHNQYIEIAAEGGLLLGLPLLVLAAALARRITQQLRTPRRATFWLRAGATAALAGLAVACIWESPFRTPATLMLAAVAAGLATGRD